MASSLCPGVERYCYMNPDVRAYQISLLKELATNYDIDGIALDFCRPGGGCFCERCRKLFEEKFHKPLKGIDPYDTDWLRWQREAVTDYMRQLAAAVRQATPKVTGITRRTRPCARELQIVSEAGVSQAGLFTFSNSRVHLETLKAHSMDANVH